MKTTEIIYGNSITINKGNYENEKPLYSAKTITDQQIDIKEETLRLKAIVDPLVEEHSKSKKVDLSSLRIRELNGKQYPSYSSISSMGKQLQIDEEYSLRGTELHNMTYEYLKTGTWPEPSIKLERLKYEDIKHKEFFEKFGDQIELNEIKPIVVYHHDAMYSGEIDLVAKIKGLTCIIDFKTGGYSMTQLIAYWKACPDPSFIDALCIFDFKKCELKMIRVNEAKVEPAFLKFVIKRGQFRERFGV